MNYKLTVAALVAGCLSLAACNKSEAPAQQQTVAAPTALVVPTGNDDQAWKKYLTEVVKRNMEGINARPFVYYLPSAEASDFEDQYERQLENVAGVVGRGVLPGNMLAFGSPESGRLADLVVDAFGDTQAGSLKDVRVLFVGKAEDQERVKAAVEPTGAVPVFHEVK